MQVSDELARLFANLGRALNRKAVPELAPADAAVLFTLAARPDGVRLSDLAHLKGLDVSTMSRRVSQLIDRDLVTRSPDPEDGRAVVITLTPEGYQQLTRERARRVQLVTQTLEDWGPEDKDRLASMLCRLNDSLEAAHE